jgi:hypothetical protein
MLQPGAGENERRESPMLRAFLVLAPQEQPHLFAQAGYAGLPGNRDRWLCPVPSKAEPVGGGRLGIGLMISSLQRASAPFPS